MAASRGTFGGLLVWVRLNVRNYSIIGLTNVLSFERIPVLDFRQGGRGFLSKERDMFRKTLDHFRHFTLGTLDTTM